MKKSTLKKHTGYWLSRLQQQITKSFEQRLQQHHIATAEWCVLVTIYDKQGDSVTSIAQYIDVSKPVVSRIIDQLVRKKLVEVKPGANRRSSVITLTTDANLLIPALVNEADTNDEFFFGCLTEIELNQLKHLINKLITQRTPIISSGWLLEASSMKNNIEKILNTAKKEQWKFPQVFEQLRQAGMLTYEVILDNGYAICYTLADNTCIEESQASQFTDLKVAKDFAPDKAKHAILTHQQDKIDYPQWVYAMAAAGVASYLVNMKERIITYFNLNKTESFIELVPEQ